MKRQIFDVVQVGTTFADARAILIGDPTVWLPAPAEPLNDAYLVTLTSPDVPVLGVDARVTVDPVTVDGEELVVLPISWRAASADRAFPSLAAELELTRLGEGALLTIVGAYRPPLSVVGAVADQLLGRRLAATTLRQFLEDVSGRLQRPRTRTL